MTTPPATGRLAEVETASPPAAYSPQGGGLAPSSRTAYAADWALFVDWCTATGRPSLPASVDTVIAFLDDNTATPATWRRRVAAIDHFHATRGHSSPGHDPAVVDLVRAAAGEPALDSRPAAMDREQLAGLLERIPTHGWPAGLVGRRDRFLLTLHVAGLIHRQLQHLRTDDLEIVDGVLVVHPLGQAEPIHIRAGLEGVCGLCAWAQWRQVLHITTNYPGIRIIRDAFWHTPAAPTPLSSDHAHREVDGPAAGRLFGAIDRYGYLDRRTPLSLRAISHRLAGYHRGDIPTFRFQDPPPPKQTHTEISVTPAVPASPQLTDTERAHQHLERVRQRANDRAKLDRLNQTFDELDERIDALSVRAEVIEQALEAIAHPDVRRPGDR